MTFSTFFSEIVEITADRFKFALYTCQLSSKVRDVFPCRHMLDDVGEHFAEFLKCRFLCCHMREVYHAGRSMACGLLGIELTAPASCLLGPRLPPN